MYKSKPIQWLRIPALIFLWACIAAIVVIVFGMAFYETYNTAYTTGYSTGIGDAQAVLNKVQHLLDLGGHCRLT